MHNCRQCKDVIRDPDDELCNACILEVIRARRPSFIITKRDYPEIIRDNYVQDLETKIWTPRSTRSEQPPASTAS